MLLDEWLAQLDGVRPLPAGVAEYLRLAELRVDQIRWCDWCQVIAVAIDNHQVSRLDAVGFDTLCPDCKCPGP